MSGRLVAIFAALFSLCVAWIGILMLFDPRRLARSWMMRYGPMTEDQLRSRWYRIQVRIGGALMAALCLHAAWSELSGLVLRDRSVIQEPGGRIILQTGGLPERLYWYLGALLLALFFMMVLWGFVYNGIRMLIGPEKWMSSSWMARFYGAKLRGKVTPWQLRVVGLGWVVWGIAVLVTMATQVFR
jgi:hypothetical protein